MEPTAEAAPLEVEVVGDAPAGADPARTSASVTVVPVDDRLPPGADVGTALSAVPGAVVRRLGGLGSYTSVAVRGSTARQVEVQLAGIPLNPDGASAVDLSELPLWALDRIEVWRSDPPVGAGPGGVGGVVDLIPADRTGAEGAFAAGSYGTSTARATWGGPRGLLAVDGFATEGSFPYFDDGGTPFTTEDDAFRTRTNADRRRVAALGTAAGGRWRALGSVSGTDQGVPGFTWQPTEDVRYGAWRGLSAVELATTRGASRWTSRAWGLGRSERFTDPAGEIGLGAQDLSTRSGSAGIDATVTAAPAAGVSGSASVRYRLDAIGGADALAGTVDAGRWRQVAHGGGSIGLRHDGLLVSPTLWALVLDDHGPDGSAGQLSLLPRLGARWCRCDTGSQLAVKANLGRYVRPPDLDELFGDRGATVGNPDLVPEDAWQADLGLVAAKTSVSLELTGYWTAVSDAIVYVQNAQQVARPVNLDAATLRGIELGGAWSAAGVDARLAATLTDSMNRGPEPYTGNVLPRTPAWSVESTVSGRRGPAQLGATGSFTAGSWLDAANFERAAPRLLLGAFGRASAGPWSLTGEVRNVLDRITEVGPRDPLVDDGVDAVRAVTDFTGYPLPGRTFLLGIAWAR